jgi:hypothetical protein
MHSRVDETVTHTTTEKSVTAYKLYNLVFSGRISLQEYLANVRSLKNNERSSQGFKERKNVI